MTFQVTETAAERAPDAGAAAVTGFDRLCELLDEQQAAAAETVKMRPARLPSMLVTFRLPDGAEIDHCRESVRNRKARRSKDEAAPTMAETMAANRLLIARCTIGIAIEGEDLLEADGSPSTFASRRFLDKFTVASSADVVDRIYRGGRADGPDGDISVTANALVEAAGFGADALIEDEDPTPAR